MPAGVPVIFRRSAGEFVFNVDFFDWATGAGYKRYYCIGMEDSVGAKYVLTDRTDIWADSQVMQLIKNTDTDFDMVFNNTVTVANADCNISLTHFATDAGQAITVTVIHYDGTTETVLGTVTSGTTVATKSERKSMKVTLTQQRFTKGDILRVSIVVTTSTNDQNIWISKPGGITIADTGSPVARNIDGSCSIDIPFQIQP